MPETETTTKIDTAAEGSGCPGAAAPAPGASAAADPAGPAAAAAPKNYLIAQMDAVDPVRCPCGFARRAFAVPDNPVATLHLVDIEADSAVHYHRAMTEIYLVLDGEGHLELDGERVPVRPMTAVLIKPGCRHRAVGKLRIVNIPVPAFDPEDEHFD